MNVHAKLENSHELAPARAELMSRSMRWITGFLFGVTIILASALGLALGAGMLAGDLVFILVLGRRAGLSGSLSGFGGFLLLLMVAEYWSAGSVDSSVVWLPVSIIPLAAGLALRLGDSEPVALETPGVVGYQPEPAPSDIPLPPTGSGSNSPGRTPPEF
jgi:hypothetical protein